MDDKDIVNMIKEEEKRLDVRKAAVEEKVKENNEKFDLLVQKKTTVMEMAANIVQEEKDIQESGVKVQTLATECQTNQDKLVQI